MGNDLGSKYLYMNVSNTSNVKESIQPKIITYGDVSSITPPHRRFLNLALNNPFKMRSALDSNL